MKFLGKIEHSKDVVNKEYVDGFERHRQKTKNIGTNHASDTGWYRCAHGFNKYSGGSMFLILRRNYNYSRSESYLYCITWNYTTVEISLLSGVTDHNSDYDQRLLDKIRVDCLNADVYVDFHVGISKPANTYIWYVIGEGEAIDAEFNPTTIGTLKEFENIWGFKASNAAYVGSYKVWHEGNLGKADVKDILGISDWALSSIKPSYSFSEIISKPSTLSGYGITDASIADGVITLGGNMIAPLTQTKGDERYVTGLGTSGDAVTWSKNGKTNQVTVPYSARSGYTSYLKNYPEDSSLIGDLNSPSTFEQGGARMVYDVYSSSASNNPIVYDNANALITLFKGIHSTAQYASQLAFPDNGTFYFRNVQNGVFGVWRQIAFEDSDITGNAASATKLQTPSTIWGQSFDGTANVSGSLSGATTITASDNVKTGGSFVVESGRDAKIILNNTDAESKYSWISFRQDGTEYGCLGTGSSGDLQWKTDLILHTSNYSSYAVPLTRYTDANVLAKIKNVDGANSGLDADLLDGQHGAWYQTNVLRFKTVYGTETAEGYDCNTITEGLLANYDSVSYWKNAPDKFSYGCVLNLVRDDQTLSGQLAWDINHSSTTDRTNSLWWRVSGDGTFTETKWHQIAFVDRSAKVLHKEQTGKNLLLDGAKYIGAQSYLIGKYDYDSSVVTEKKYRVTVCGKLGKEVQSVRVFFDGGVGGNYVVIDGLSNKEERVVTVEGTMSNKKTLAFYQYPNGKYGSYVKWAHLELIEERDETLPLLPVTSYLFNLERIDFASSENGAYLNLDKNGIRFNVGSDEHEMEVSVNGNDGLTYLAPLAGAVAEKKELKYLYYGGGNKDSAAIYVLPNKYVGIGKTPEKTLDVNGTFAVSGDTTLNSASVSGALSVTGATSLSGRLEVGGETTLKNSIYFSDPMYGVLSMTRSGGWAHTSIGYKGHTSGELLARFGGYGNNEAFNYFYLGKSHADAWMVVNENSLGVGTTSPDAAYRLHVNGSAYVSNDLLVGGVRISKPQEDILYIDSNVVVRGGITMFGDNSTSPSSIWDGLPIDDKTIYWDGGILKAKVGLDTEALGNYLVSNNYAVKSDIPTKLGQFVNDRNYTTGVQVEEYLGELEDIRTFSAVIGYKNDNNKIENIGWYRCAHKRGDLSSGNMLLFLNKGYNYSRSEAFVFGISWTYGYVTVTQLSGSVNSESRTITKIRTDVKGGELYVDFYISRSVKSNPYYWYVIGDGVGQSFEYNPTTIGTLKEFETCDGLKSESVKVGNNDVYHLGNIARLKTDLGLGSLAYRNSLSESDIPSLSWSKITSIPTTLSGYGITDAKIADGIITLGGNTIAPLTQTKGDERYVTGLGTSGDAVTWSKNGKTNQVTVPYSARSGYTSYLKNYPEDSSLIGDLNSPSTFEQGGARMVYDVYSSSASNNPIVYDNANALITLFKGIHSTAQYASQLAFPDNGTFYFRNVQNGVFGVWRQIAFEDSDITGNAASATKLQTPSTIWGQSFDGTANVSGSLSGATTITASDNVKTGGSFVVESGRDAKIILNNTDAESKYSWISFRQDGTEYGCLGTGSSGDLQWKTDLILHTSNYSSYAVPLTRYTDANVLAKIKNVDGANSGLDADLLDGQHGAWYQTNVLRFKTVYGTETAEGYDCNTITEGLLANYDSVSYWKNAPDKFSYGCVLNLVRDDQTLSGQLAWDINHSSTTDRTNSLWWRVSGDGTFTETKWHQIAFVDRSAKVLHKEQTGKNLLLDGAKYIGAQSYLIGKYDYDSSVVTEKKYRVTVCGKLGKEVQSVRVFFDGGVGGNYVVIDGLSNKEERVVTVEGTMSNKKTLAFYQYPNGKYGSYVKWAHLELIEERDETLPLLPVTSYLFNLERIDFASSENGAYLNLDKNGIRFNVGSDEHEMEVSVNGNDGLTYLAPLAGAVAEKKELKYLYYGGGNKDSAAIYVLPNKYVGIGKTPEKTLDVNGTFAVSGDTTLNSASVSGALSVTGATSLSGRLEVGGETTLKNSIYFSDPMYGVLSMTRSGGWAHTSIGYKGHTSGELLARFGGYGNNEAFNYFYLGKSYADAWMVVNENSLGVGTTSPDAAYRLHVNGNSYISSNLLVGGAVTMYSAKSLKNIVNEDGLSLQELQTIKPTRFTWKDNRDSRIHIGGIADDIMKVLPEVVYKNAEGVLTMDYGNAAFAMAASLVKPVSEHARKIVELESEIVRLKQHIEKLKDESL